jgi:putative flippase GtrA
MAQLNIESQKIRFVLVGGANTTIDFGLLFILTALGLPTLFANIVSTTVAFCFSFFANKKFTFQSSGKNIKRELLLFVIVTLFGLWGIQSAIIAGIKPPLQGIIHDPHMALLAAKLIATVASLIWNYILYSRVVFVSKKD